MARCVNMVLDDGDDFLKRLMILKKPHLQYESHMWLLSIILFYLLFQCLVFYSQVIIDRAVLFFSFLLFDPQ
jgi:hypothetical protein